jgi:hypothetical protein
MNIYDLAANLNKLFFTPPKFSFTAFGTHIRLPTGKSELSNKNIDVCSSFGIVHRRKQRGCMALLWKVQQF